MKDGRVGQRGFTLVELLVVVAIMGLVTMAVYSLYQNNQRSNLKQDQVVELQQNLRIAMEQIRRDILFAGFMCAAGTAIQSAPNESIDLNSDDDYTDAGDSGSAFILGTASTAAVGVRIDIPAPLDSTSGAASTFRVASSEMARLLVKDDYVRIIRPGDFGQPVDRVLKVTSVSVADAANPTVTVTDFNATGTYRTGYLIVRVSDPNDDSDGNPNTDAPPHPSTIQYYLEKDTDSTDPALRRLVRNPSDNDRSRIATNITQMEFNYLLDDGTEIDAVTAAQLDEIRAIRVTLTGATDANQSAGAGGVTTRTLSSVIALRNR